MSAVDESSAISEYTIDTTLPGSGDLRFIVATQDYDGLVSFYRDALGLPVYRAWSRPDGKGTLLRAGAATIEVLDAPDDSPYVRHGGIGIGIEVDDVDEWHARAAAAGVSILHAPLMEHGFRVCRFIDPAGVVVMAFRRLNSGTGPVGRREEK